MNIPTNINPASPVNSTNSGATKFCKHCGNQILSAAVFCVHCGCQVEDLHSTAQPNIVINNNNTNTNTNTINHTAPVAVGLRPRNKWVAFLLCLFFGYLGVHKFYENKIGLGILYIFTFGLFGIGWFIDLIVLLFKPNPYFVL